jgi:hypothetical protein
LLDVSPGRTEILKIFTCLCLSVAACKDDSLVDAQNDVEIIVVRLIWTKSHINFKQLKNFVTNFKYNNLYIWQKNGGFVTHFLFFYSDARKVLTTRHSLEKNTYECNLLSFSWNMKCNFMCSFTYICMWANVYTRGKFKLSAFIKDRDYVIYKLNLSSINDVIFEDLREKQIMQNVYTFFYYVLTP